MKRFLKTTLLSLAVFGLIGCKTVLPKPDNNQDSLVLAPFAADNASRSSGAWLYDYILNNDTKSFIRINPKRVQGDFAIQTGLPEGEYTITALRNSPRSVGRLRAIGEERITPIPAEEQITFEVKKNKITILPIKIIFTRIKQSSSISYTDLDFQLLDSSQLAEQRQVVHELEGIEGWEVHK